LLLALPIAARADDSAVPRPSIPDKRFVITDFGAVADGKTDATDGIAKAIAACRGAGGGIVVVPAGKFLTRPFALASNLNLHLDKDATLLLVNDIASFPLKDGRYVDW